MVALAAGMPAGSASCAFDSLPDRHVRPGLASEDSHPALVAPTARHRSLTPRRSRSTLPCCRSSPRTVAEDLDGLDQDASGQTIDIDAELGGDPGFFFRFDFVSPGVDVNPFPDVGSLGPDLDGLVSQEDQLCPGLSDAEGSYFGSGSPGWNIQRRDETDYHESPGVARREAAQ